MSSVNFDNVNAGLAVRLPSDLCFLQQATTKPVQRMPSGEQSKAFASQIRSPTQIWGLGAQQNRTVLVKKKKINSLGGPVLRAREHWDTHRN